MDVENIKVNLKRFISNPNTLTFLLVIALIIVVYFVYNSLVNRAVSPVTLSYCTKLLSEETEITGDVVSTVKLSGTFVTSSGEELVQNRGQILNKFVALGYQIPQNSFFYRSAITDEANTNKRVTDDIPDGYTTFELKVDFHKTYGCSIMPGNYIDLYFKAKTDKDDKIIYDLFIKSIRVEAVLDKEGNNVFTHTKEDEEPKPELLVFAVPNDYKELLETASLITSNSIELIPVPRNAGYSENPEDTSIANEAIVAFIQSKAVPVVN